MVVEFPFNKEKPGMLQGTVGLCWPLYFDYTLNVLHHRVGRPDVRFMGEERGRAAVVISLADIKVIQRSNYLHYLNANYFYRSKSQKSLDSLWDVCKHFTHIVN